jgi:osmotically-inducible protein OsmY
MGTKTSFLAGAAAGAAAAYFLDPQGGAQRRNQTRDKALSQVKSGASGVAGSAKQAAGKARGTVANATPTMPWSETPDDVTLARTVESEIFRAADAPKGAVSVNAENGVVFLRGVVEDRDWIERFEAETRKVDGVKEVRNLLHLPGTEAPAAPATH